MDDAERLLAELGDARAIRLLSFPAAKTPQERFAVTDSWLAGLHESCQTIWLMALPDPERRELVVAVAADDRGEAPTTLWWDRDATHVAPTELDSLVAGVAHWRAFTPLAQPDVAWRTADLTMPSTLDQLRLLEESRLPSETAIVIRARPVSATDARELLQGQLDALAPQVAERSEADVARWSRHQGAVHASQSLAGQLEVGIWQVNVRVGGAGPAAIGRAVASVNESLRLAVPYGLSSVDDFDAARPATTRLLSVVGVPPFGEIAGFRSTSVWFFDQSQERPVPPPIVEEAPLVAPPGVVPLGQVLTPAGSMATAVGVGRSNLVRHTLVAGATGSGKTETVKSLVLGVQEVLDTPWLIIEPAKSEYGMLRWEAEEDDPDAPRTVEGPIVIRPGSTEGPPLQINPLEPHPGFPLRTHLDLVLALFGAAFEPMEPLPQILASALESTYHEAGWIVPLGVLEGTDPAAGSEAHAPSPSDYPSLGDLQSAALTVVEEIGYGPEANDTIRGFINVRLRSLRLGTAGRMFEHGHPVDFDALMQERVVIQLDDVGSDQERSFIMGVVLLRLYEHLRVEADKGRATGSSSRSLSHLTVVEEAHRLLRAAVPGEKPNFAVDTFANMMAELRSYGEGLVVVEQVPTKIVSDAIKNTGTKILHRLPAVDDRAAAGLAANMEPENLSALGALRPGEAVLFTDEMDRPVRARIRRTPSIDGPIGQTGDVQAILGVDVHLGQPPGHRWTLSELVHAERAVDAHPAVALWLELALAMRLRGWTVLKPGDAVAEPWAAFGPCAWNLLARDAIAPRRRAIRGSGADPDAVASALFDFLAAGPPPDDLGAAEFLGDLPAKTGLEGLLWGWTKPSRAVHLARLVPAGSPADLVQVLWGLEDQPGFEAMAAEDLPGVFEASVPDLGADGTPS